MGGDTQKDLIREIPNLSPIVDVNSISQRMQRAWKAFTTVNVAHQMFTATIVASTMLARLSMEEPASSSTNAKYVLISTKIATWPNTRCQRQSSVTSFSPFIALSQALALGLVGLCSFSCCGLKSSTLTFIVWLSLKASNSWVSSKVLVI